MKCHSTSSFRQYKKSQVYPMGYGRRAGQKEWEGEEKKDKQESPITVREYELYMSCSFNAICSLPHFVTIKYSQQQLCRPLLITHQNNKRSQTEIAIANLH